MPGRTLRSLAVVALALFAAGCGGSATAPAPVAKAANRTHIDGWSAISTIIEIISGSSSEGAPSVETLLADAPTTDSDHTFYRNAFNWLAGRIVWDAYEVDGVELAYEGRALDQMGLPSKRFLSGAVFMPTPDDEKISVPIVVYTHGTELKRSLVASKGLVQWGYDPKLGGLEGVFGVALASAGPAIVLMPDFQGMGADDDLKYYHPYVHRDSLAWAGVDMVTGFQAMVKAKADFLPPGVTWNGKVYVMGYSEGGFAAMAFTREWEVQKANGGTGFPLHCSAPLAGPHSLSEEMVAVMTNTTKEFTAPFFLPYVLYGYERVYPSLIHPDEAIKQDYVSKGLREWMSGGFTGSWVNERIWAVGGQKVPVGQLLDPAWMEANLKNTSSEVYRTIAANDTVVSRNDPGSWTNSMPMYLIHSQDDDLVPFGNSQKAKSRLEQWGAQSAGVALRTVSPNGWKPGHGAAAPWALMGGMYWLMNGCKE